MARVNYRWPVAECLHEHTTGPREIVNGRMEVVHTLPERCYDCGAKRTKDGWR